MTYEASRKKQILVLQPRGKALYEDTSTFGSKMLEKMGWKKGDGLGKDQKGNVDFIQIRYKNDEHGLGFNKFKMDDNWTQNETSFDELLKSLNNNGAGEDDEQSTTKKSLLEKSAKSRARVHYKKRIQCKDVHKYSEKDLANILGKKTLKEESSGSDAEKVETATIEMSKCEEEDVPSSAYESSLNVKSKMSLRDYFKNKMDSKNGKPEMQESYELETVDEEPETKTKKSKKIKSDSLEEPAQEVEVESSVKKKSKKKKRAEIDETPEVEEVVEVEKVKSKSKKRKHEVETIDIEVEKPVPTSSKKKEKKAKTEDASTTPKPAEQKIDPSLKGVNSAYGSNVIQIPSYMANKLANMSVDEFANSNLPNIIGYGMTENTEIKVLQTKVSETAGNVDKYTLYNNDKLETKRVNPRKILSSIKKIKKSIQVI